MPMAQLTVMVSALLGWSDIEIKPAAATGPLRRTGAWRPWTVRPSGRWRRSSDTSWSDEYRRDVNNTLLRIEKYAQRRAEAELVYALAELSWIEGKRLDRWRKPQALDRYLDAAAYAHDFLFETIPCWPRAEGRPIHVIARPWRFTTGVDHLIRAAMTKGHIQRQEGEIVPFKFHGRERKLRIVLQDSPWKSRRHPQDPPGLRFRGQRAQQDLPVRTGRAAHRRPRDSENKKGERPPQERFYPTEMAFPLTAFLVPNSRLRDPNVDVEEARVMHARVSRSDPEATVGYETRQQAALEIDLTTPLAYMWSRTDLDRYRWSGLLRPGKDLERANLLLIRPYEPGKIPVVMVHGLISTPLAWIPMLNELLRDPEIQSNISSCSTCTRPACRSRSPPRACATR